MKSKCLIFVFISLLGVKTNAQINIQTSKIWGGTGQESQPISKKVGNVIHIVGYTYSTNYPVTDASTTDGEGDLYYTQINATSGEILLSTIYQANSSSEWPVSMVVDNGSVYVIGITFSDNFPVTNSSTLANFYQQMFYMKINSSDGSIAFATYLGGTIDGEENPRELLVENGVVHILNETYASDFPVTNSSTYTPGDFYEQDLTYTQIDANTGDILFSTYIGGGGGEYGKNLVINDGKVHILGSSTSANFPVTNGSVNAGNIDIVYLQLDENTGEILFSTYLGGNTADDPYGDFFIQNDRVHITGYTQSGDFPVTDGSTYSAGSYDAFYLQLDASTGSINCSKFIGGNGYDEIGAVRVVDNYIHLFGNSSSSNFPVTNSSQLVGTRAGFHLKLNESTGAIISGEYLSAFIGSTKLHFSNSILSCVGYMDASSANYPITNGSSHVGGSDVLFTQYNILNGKLIGATNLGGSSSDSPIDLYIEGDTIQIVGQNYAVNTNFPTTDGSANKGDYDLFYVVLKTCSNAFRIGTDTLSPAKQTICKTGLAQTIIGTSITLPGDSLPVIYKNGIAALQPNQGARYQWQNASTGVGPWFDISGAINKDYQPIVGTSNQYYRRLTFNSAGCMDTISISSVDTILVSSGTSPTVNGGGVFHTCPGSSVTIGGSPTASSRSNSFTYSWIAGNDPTVISTSANPVVSPSSSTIYTVTVYSGVSCSQISQAIVNVHSAQAGSDVSVCAGDSVRINSVPVSGLAGTTYAWSPSSGLGCTSCIQPKALVSSSTTYTLTQTISKTGGGTCNTTDEVEVVPIDLPTTSDFAGNDKVICYGTTTVLGKPADFVSMPYTVTQSTVNTYTGSYSNLTDANYTTGARTNQYNYIPIISVSQSSINGYTGSSANLTDEDYSTGARTSTGLNQWIMVDLGSIKYIGGVRLSAILASNLNSRAIEASVDGTSWGNIKSGYLSSMSHSALIDVTQYIYRCRYVRVRTTSSSQSVDLSELRVLEAQWIQIDLGKSYENITKIQVSALSAANLNGSEIQSSTDNSTWTTRISNITGNSNSALVTINLYNTVSTRYLRFIRKSDVPLDVSELKVYQTFSYTWASGNYLTSNALAETTFNPGNLFFPTNPDSITYYLTASRQGCSFTDEVTVSVIRADAGSDGCGPREIGGNSDVISLNESFSWSVISGSGSISGSNDLPITNVTASSTGNPTTYRLTTTYKGQTCTDDVYVPDCNCGVAITSSASFGCPNFNLNAVQLTATPQSGQVLDFDFIWTVDSGQAGGLDVYNKNSVNLTDNKPRKYKVSIVNKFDNSFTCYETIEVNQPEMNLPVFTAIDTVICSGQSISIGQASVSGYSYLWTPAATLSSNSVSNPTATPTTSTDYKVTVIDVGSGCRISDTASVEVRNPVANAGYDGIVCNSSAVFPLGGETARANYTYSWSPSNANWQSGTSSSSAKPSVLVAINTTFTLTATDLLTGCVDTDEVNVVVNASPTAGNAPNITICKTLSDTIGLQALAGAIYSWTPTTGLSCSNCATPIASPNSTTTYTNTITYPGGCNASDDVTVTISDAAFTLADVDFCPSGGAVTIGSDAPNGMTTYSWSPSALVNSPSSATTSTLNPAPNSATTYTLTVTNSNGCSASSAQLINPTLSPPDAGSNRSICLTEGSLSIGSSSNPTGGTISYSWSPATNLSSSTSPNPTFTPTAAGTYTFTLTKTDSSIPCSSTSSVTITVKDFTLPSISQPTICEGASVQIGPTFESGVTYYWHPATNLSDVNVANPLASPSSSTTYNLVAVGANGCSASRDVAVTVSSNPAPEITIDDINACVSQGFDTLRPVISPSGNYNYLWTSTNGLLSDVNALNPRVSFAYLGTKTYTFTAINTTNGCSNSKEVEVTVDACYTISGVVYNDNTGNQDSDVDGTGIGLPSSTPLWVYLSQSETIVDSAKVNTNGSYHFSQARANSNYGLRLSSFQTAIGLTTPIASLPSNWVNTGEDYGRGNLIGTGIESGVADGSISISVGFENINDVNFGIQNLPITYSKNYTLSSDPGFHQVLDLVANNGMGSLSANDLEDGNLRAGKNFIIKSISGLNSNTLFYDANNNGLYNDGEALTNESLIQDYDSTKLSVKFDGDNSTGFSFTYAAIDGAGFQDLTPASYTVNWSAPLPVSMLYIQARWQNNTAIIDWATGSEINNSHFIIERSLDGLNYEYLETINSKAIGGNSVSKLNYELFDYGIKLRTKDFVYYRLIQVDYNGVKTRFEPVVLKVSKGKMARVAEYPNPASDVLNLDFENLSREKVTVNLVDLSGKTLISKEISIGSDFQSEQLDVSKLANGLYTIEIKGETIISNHTIVKQN